MFRKILIANRGEIAVRIARTARRMGVATVAIYSDADRSAMHVAVADQALRAGPAAAAESYLDQEKIISLAKDSGAEAIHPGYGFLSENPDFADAVTAAGLVFIGPPASAIRAMGLKHKARELMEKAGVPVLPGSTGDTQDTEHLASEAARIGYPVLIKPVAGGGGKGMHRVDDPGDLAEAIARARREAISSFGDGGLLLEKFLAKARHIEIQVFADARGNTVHLFERDCSLQRRHQKVIEEAPAPGMTPDMRNAMGTAAVEAARAVGYVGAGTIEFIADVSEGLNPDRFYFMEMNTRLQVEHPVTETITGVDLVEWQLRVAAGEPLPLRQSQLMMTGHAIEARIYAEDPARNFQPQTGRLTQLKFPAGARIDSGVREGDIITPHYDPLIAKLIVHGRNRAVAMRRLSQALAQIRIAGCRTNLDFLNRLARHPEFAGEAVDIGFIGRHIDSLTAEPSPPLEAVAASMLHALGYLAKPATHSPFDTLTNFRLWPGDRLRADFTPGELQDAGRGKFLFRDGERSLAFTLLSHTEDALQFDLGPSIVSITYSHSGGTLTIGFDGSTYRFDKPETESSAGENEDGSGLLIAPMPGLVRDVRVRPGDRVERHDTIAVTESMKMEFSLKAPRGGTVTAVNVAAGDQIEEGAVIAMIEAGDA